MESLRRSPVALISLTAALLFALFTFAISTASAHILNETNEFPDIAFSSSAGDIMTLVALGIVPSTEVFEPDAPLTLEDLSAWAGQSLDGNATYADINERLFGGELDLADPDATPTRAEAATFISDHLTAQLSDGSTLIGQVGAIPGPTGRVNKVEVEGEGHHAVVTLTIGNTTLPVYAHARVAFGTTDFTGWEGRNVTRSVIATDPDSGSPVLMFVQAARE